MTVHFTLVVNPTAGGGRPARYLPKVTAVLDAAGTSYTVCESTSLEHARMLAAEAAGRKDTVVAFGGDGLASALAGTIAEATARSAHETGEPTARETGEASAADSASTTQTTTRPVTDAQAAPDPDASAHPAAEPTWRALTGQAARTRQAGAFGIIPAGRGNDVARTLRIPFEPAAAARLLAGGRLQPVDLISVTGAGGTRVIIAGSVYVGIASVAGEIANRARLIRGPMVYNIAALRALIGWKSTTFRVAATGADGRQAVLQFRGYAVVVANTPYFGAGMKVAPDADYTDGVLDIVLMRHAPKLTFVRALMKIKDGSHVTLAQVNTGRATEVTVTVDRSLPTGADGELLGVRPPLHMRVLPAALNMIVPR